MPARVRPYLVVVCAAVLVVSTWFRRGTFIATGDMGPFIRQGWLPEAAWSWNHTTTGAGSAAYTVARGFEFVLIEVCRALGGDEYTAQWVFYTGIYSLVGVGVAYLAGAFVRGAPGICAAGLFGMLNGFFLTRLPNPLNVISVGTVALVTGIAVRVAQGRAVPPAVAGAALLPTSFLSFNPPMLVVAYAWALMGAPVLVLAAFGRVAAGRLLRWLVRATPWVLALNLWWLVPLAQSYTGGGGPQANAEFTDPTSWTWSQINNRVHNVVTLVANWAWFRPQYLPFAADLDRPWLIWARYLLPAVVVLAPVVAARALRRPALAVLGGVGLVVVLAKGLMPPLSGVNLWLYLHVPGFWLFREPMSKLGQLLVCFYGVLLAVFVQGVLAGVRRAGGLCAAGWGRRTGACAAVAGVLLPIAYPYPLWTGSVIPDTRPGQPSAHVRVPDHWWRAAEVIDSDTRPGKVLVLPAADYYQMPTTWGFFGVDSIANLLVRHPVISPKPSGYFGDVPGFAAAVRAVETALVAGDLRAVPRLLAALGVAKVLVRHDLVRGLPGRSFADDRVLSAALARTPGMGRLMDGVLELWQAPEGSGAPVRAYSGAVEAPAPAEAVAAAVATAGGSTAVTTSEVVGGKPASVRMEAASSADVLHWPVPPVDAGVPTTTVALPPGRFRLAQRARAPAMLVPTAGEGALVLRDPTAVLLDGEVVSTRPDLVLPVPRPDVVAVEASGRTVSLDGWGRDALPSPAPAAVVVGAATRVRAFAPSSSRADPAPYSDVYDCNNYEPRAAWELGLRRDLEGDLVRLTALDHAACTRVVVRDAEPGRVYRVRAEYRTVRGKRPQICLSQPGTDGCELAARPVLSDRWHPFEAFTTVRENATGLEVVLHADVGERLVEPTVTEYRGLQVEALDQVLDQVVFPPEPDEPSLDLAPGPHELAVTGGPQGAVLEPFEPLQDCFRYDDLTAEQAQLMAEEQISGQRTTYVMGARDHMACIGASAPDMGNAPLYALTLQARKVAVRDPKWCLYLRGPEMCAPLPGGGPFTDWFDYSALVQPDPRAAETRLYLYARRDITGIDQSRVEYRDIALRATATPSAVVLVRELAAPAPPEVRVDRVSPVEFAVEVAPSDREPVLALTETRAPGWVLRGGAGEKATVHGWMNAWRLRGGNGVRLVYAPAAMSRYALASLPVSVCAALAWTWFTRPVRSGRHRRHRRRGWRGWRRRRG